MRLYHQLRHEQTPLSSPNSSGPSRDLMRPRRRKWPHPFCLHIKAPQSRHIAASRIVSTAPAAPRSQIITHASSRLTRLGQVVYRYSLRNCANVIGASSYPAAPLLPCSQVGWRLLVII